MRVDAITEDIQVSCDDGPFYPLDAYTLFWEIILNLRRNYTKILGSPTDRFTGHEVTSL